MLKDTLGSLFVAFVVVRVDKEVIHIDDKLSLCNHVPKRVGHEPLKCGGRVGHSKEHDSGFIESMVSDEGCLPLVSFLDVNIVISPSYIKLGEDLCIFEFVN